MNINQDCKGQIWTNLNSEYPYHVHTEWLEISAEAITLLVELIKQTGLHILFHTPTASLLSLLLVPGRLRFTIVLVLVKSKDIHND